MSIQVALEDLADEVVRRGPGYLLTTDAGSRPHVMHVEFVMGGNGSGDGNGLELRAPIGRSAGRNITTQPAVTLLWPPEEPGGLSLIVDGTAMLDGTAPDGTASALVTALRAVLHRPA